MISISKIKVPLLFPGFLVYVVKFGRVLVTCEKHLLLVYLVSLQNTIIILILLEAIYLSFLTGTLNLWTLWCIKIKEIEHSNSEAGYQWSTVGSKSFWSCTLKKPLSTRYCKNTNLLQFTDNFEKMATRVILKFCLKLFLFTLKQSKAT